MLIGYARVSTTEQSLDLQLDALKKAGCERVFSDVMSGSKDRRPELDKCLRLLRPGDVLMVWKLDRLGRSMRHLVNVIGDLEARDIGFKALTGDIDTTTPTGRLLLGILASLAEFERSLIVERVRAGMAAAKARGVHCGRPRRAG
jgi:DNA invertase Pin-like site-specific DNA recombinase